MKKLSYWMILLIVLYGFIELTSYGGLYFLGNFRNINYDPLDVLSKKHTDIISNYLEQGTEYNLFSSDLGWSIKENGVSKLYQANSSGIRGNKEYSFNPAQTVRRVSTFGDSFTHCDDVNNNETWQAIMESHDSNLEVLNFGVGGFGLDQAYLRYLKDGRRYSSDITLIGFMSENIFRNVTTFRPFYFRPTGLPLTKPRFTILNSKLLLIPNQFGELADYKRLLQHPQEVLQSLGVHDYSFKNGYIAGPFDWSPTVKLTKIIISKARKNLSNNVIIKNGYYNANSEAFKVTKKIFDQFYGEIINHNSTPIIVIFPNKADIIRYQTQKTKRYSPLLSYFDSRGYRYIDLLGALGERDAKELVVSHYTYAGNELVAEHIKTYLDNMSKQDK
jgi:hypothetical protein